VSKYLGMERRFRLRWALHYANGAVRRGVWDCHEERDPSTLASRQPRDGLVFATIEAKCLQTNQIVRVLSVDAPNLTRFYWQHAMIAPALMRGKSSAGGRIIGLGIETFSGNKVTVMFNGKVHGVKADVQSELKELKDLILN